MTSNPYFETASSWKAARAMLTFQPLRPGSKAGMRLQFLRIHVRDHKMRVLPVNDRTLATHYGGFVFTQARKGVKEAQRLALVVPYGLAGRDAQVAGHAARVYELGPEPPLDDIDGRGPSVVVWHDAELFCFIASYTMQSDELVRIAISVYPQKSYPKSRRRGFREVD